MLALYIDEDVMVASHHVLQRVYAFLSSDKVHQRVHRLGYRCLYWWPKPPPASKPTMFNDKVVQKKTSGTLELRSPIGSSHFVQETIQAETLYKAYLHNVLAKLYDPHEAFIMLVLCISTSKMNYRLSMTPPLA